MQNRTINLFNSAQTFIFVDTSRDKLYAAAGYPTDPSGNSALFYIVNNASTADEPHVTALIATLSATNIRLSAVAVKP